MAGPEMAEERWRVIKEWEGNCLAEPRPESEALSREMLVKFIDILRDHSEEIDRVAAGPFFRPAGGTPPPPKVPRGVLGFSRGVCRGGAVPPPPRAPHPQTLPMHAPR